MKEKTKKKIEAAAREVIETAANIRAKNAALEAELKEKQQEAIKRDLEAADYKKIREERDPARQLQALTKKSRKEIIEAGTPKELAYLFAISVQTALDSGGKFLMLETEYNSIRARLSQAQRAETMKYSSTILALKAKEEPFKYDMLCYMKDAAFLARYIAQWAERKVWAEKYTPSEEFTPYEYEHLEKMYNRKARVDGSMLVIKEQATAIKKLLRAQRLPWAACPYDMRVCIEDLETEVTLKDFDLEDIYFRSRLNDLIDGGEEPSSYEIECALLPSYKELRPREEEVANYLRIYKAEAAHIFENERAFVDE